jgi:UPF0176 protein
MTWKVATFYQFVALMDFRELREPLRQICTALKLKGTVLLAHEGVNGTLAGDAEAIAAFIDELRSGALFAGRLDNLELKLSSASEMPFQKLKVRLKKEIVTFGNHQTDPTRRVGAYVDAGGWNKLLETPGIVLIDTRNQFEVALGTFAGAVDPGIKRFSEFRDYVERELDPVKHKKIAMFCTGGIRCEKASSYMISQGFEEVYHLKGGILKYLEDVPKSQSQWNGDCFVFDERVTLGHGLEECSNSKGDRIDVSSDE